MKNISYSKRATSKGYVWQYRFDTAPINGQRRRKSQSGFRTKNEAKIAAEKAYDLYYSTGEYGIKKTDMSFSDFIYNVWLPYRRDLSQWQQTTEKGYRKRIKNYIIPSLGGYSVSDVPATMIQKTLNDLYYPADGKCHQTVSDIHGLLVSIFKCAVANKYIRESPMTFVMVPKLKESEKEKIPAKNKQKRDIIPKEILNAVFEKFPEGTSAYLPMMLSLKTGMRLGEVFGLCWDDIDFERETITINRQFQEEKESYICNPKYNSKRTVPLCSDLKAILLKEKYKQNENRIRYGDCYLHVYSTKRFFTDRENTHGVCDLSYGSGEKEMFFVNVREDGEVVSPGIMKYVSRVIHGYPTTKISKERIYQNDAEHPYVYEYFNTHSLRHTFASQLREQGVNEIVIGELLGHKSSHMFAPADVTLTYLHSTEKEMNSVKNLINCI